MTEITGENESLKSLRWYFPELHHVSLKGDSCQGLTVEKRTNKEQTNF